MQMNAEQTLAADCAPLPMLNFLRRRTSAWGNYADLAIMWIEDTKRAPTAVDQRLARILMSA